MKYRLKIILSAIMTILLAFLFKNVSAVDSVYQAIFKYTDANERYIVYRTVVKPHSSTLDEEGFAKYNTWYENIVNAEPTWASYKTNYLIFTKNKIGSYSSGSFTDDVGYAKFSLMLEGYTSFFSDDVKYVTDWINNYASSEHVTNVTVTDNPEVFGDTPFYTYGYDEYGVPVITSANLSQEAFTKYINNTIGTVGSWVHFPRVIGAESFSTIVSSYTKWVTPVYNQWTVSGVVPFTTYRSMLYTNNTNIASQTPNSTHNTNDIYYIMDIYLDTATTNALYDYKAADPDNAKIYVSGISETMNVHYSPTKFYMLTPGAWLYSKLRKFNGSDGWTKGTLGASSTDGLQAGLNFWDNQLHVPLDEKQDKKIVVNHIAVDIDETCKLIDKEVVDKEETLTAKNADSSVYSNIDVLYLNSNKTLTTSYTNTKLLQSKQTLQNEMTQYTIKAPVDTTEYQVNQLTEQALEYKYAGYEYKGFVIDWDNKIENISETYLETIYKKEALSSGVVNFNFLNKEKEQTEVIVNLYYKEETKKVKVANKICVDDDLKNCSYVEGNRILETTNPQNDRKTTLNWTGESYIEEYTVNKKYSVKAESVNVEQYEYKGYILKEGNKETRNFKEEPESYCTSNSESDITIEFYYVKKTTTTIIPKEKPSIDIPGTLTIQSTVDVSTTCEEYYSVPTNAKNDTSDVYVGIKNTPMYVLAGINVAQQKIEDQKVTIYVNINFGPNSKKWTITVPYSMSYYAIQELLMYKYQTATISNAGLANTKGETLFNTRTLAISPIKTSLLTLNAPANTNIAYTDTNNWKNYLVTSYSLNSKINNEYNPSTTPRDEYEDNYARTLTNSNIVILTTRVPDANSTELQHSFKNNEIGDYITYEIDNSKVYVNDSLKKSYTEIALTGSTTIDIELMSEKVYANINYARNSEINTYDIEQIKQHTDDEIAEIIEEGGLKDTLEDAYDTYVAAKNSYFGQCSSYGHGYGDCYDTCSRAYETALSSCETCKSWGSYECGCDDEGKNCKTCRYCADYWSCGDSGKGTCVTCGVHSSHLNVLGGLKTTYDAALNAYETARANYNNQIGVVNNAYSNEMYALQHFDEALALQTMWFDDVTVGFVGSTEGYTKKGLVDYTEEDIAKLLGLNVKFDYSSGNAKVENTDLMTVQKHTLELVSDSTIALNGELVENDCKEQELVASRQTLTDTQKQYYTSGIVGASWLPNERNAVSSTYYKNNAYTIPITRLNGTRILAGKANYYIDSVNRVGKSKVVQDNMYYEREEDKANKVITEAVFDVNSSSSFSKDYGVTQNAEVAEKQKTNAKYNSGNVNSEEFNVYTPLVVTTEVNQDIDIIDQTATNKYNGVDVIQSNSSFTINFYNNKDKVYANNSSKPNDFTSRYKQVTYIKFEFAVTNISYIGPDGVGSFGNKAANEWIGPIYGDYITAVPYLNTTQGESVTDETYKYYVIAAAVNTNESWTRQLLAYINTSLDDLKEESLINAFKNACGYEGKNKLSYYADLEDKFGTLIIVNRMYDFRVTDLKDLDWKEVFRTNEISSYVNYHSGIAYYAGLNKWNTKNPTKYNQIIGRTSDEIGSSPTRILPLGPYKNTDTTYISAPKMGYRFSFDFKVTGSVDNNKYVKIYPSFYYISKDGTKFYTEYSSGNEGIYLFYKNSNGQYVRVGSSSDTYKIQFTPNDGYRSLVQTDIKNLNANVVTLGSLRELTLKFTETTTTSVNDAAITYYGEYKLPNSTIAVKVDKNGNYNINSPLTDGYIGVVFDIRAHESSGVDLVYGKNSYKNQTNTSQWDYEGYLGMSKPGSAYSTTLKLEKGTWKIDNVTYNKIKGTVILYDTDSKASNDFN